MNLKVDVTELNRALKEFAEYSSRDLATIINQQAKDIAWRAVRHTKVMEEKWPVRKEDAPRKLRKFSATGKARKKSTATGSKKDRLYFALAAKKGFRRAWKVWKDGKRAYVVKHSGPEATRGTITDEAQRIWARRRRAKGYIGSAWGPAISELGGNLNAKLRKFFRHGASKSGGARKATPSRHVCVITNAAMAADKVGSDALQQAVNEATAEIVANIKRKLAQRGQQLSGRQGR